MNSCVANMPKLNRAGALIFDHTLKNLLLIRGRKSHKWGPPKGHLDRSDSNPLFGGMREVEEETGVRVRFPKDKDCHYLPYVTTCCQTRLYILVIPGNYPIAIGDSNEIQDIRWWPLDSLPLEDVEISTKLLRTVCAPDRLKETVERARANLCNYQLVYIPHKKTHRHEHGIASTQETQKPPLLWLNSALREKIEQYRNARQRLTDHMIHYFPTNPTGKRMELANNWLKKFDQLKLDDDGLLLPENSTNTVNAEDEQ